MARGTRYRWKMGGERWRVWVCALLGLGPSSCWFDSGWLQGKAAQKHEAARLTLGVPHERNEASLMHARYQPKSHGYSDEAAQLMRDSLRLRERQPPVFLDADFAQTANARLSAGDADWDVTDRDQLLRELGRLTPSSSAVAGTASRGTAPPPPAPATPPSTPAPSVAGLSPDQQRSYDRARFELLAGHGLAARDIAAPLLATQANLPAVRALRCEIAMAIGGDPESLDKECRGLSAFGKPQ